MTENYTLELLHVPRKRVGVTFSDKRGLVLTWSNMQPWQTGDVFVVFLNMDTKKLVIRNHRMSETELSEGIQGNDI